MRETKEQLVKRLDEQITSLIEEYYSLVAPTQEEINEAGYILQGDGDEILCDPEATLGKYYLAGNTMDLRELQRERQKQEEADNDKR